MSGSEVVLRDMFTQGDLLIVKVDYSNAVMVPKIERRINKHGEIMALTKLFAPDKNGYWSPKTATYTVYSKNPRILKITLTQLSTKQTKISYT